MEGFTYYLIAILCALIILMFFSRLVIHTYKKSRRRNIKVFHYKKIENLYEEFILSNENKYFYLENKIRLCYLILIIFIISIPVLLFLLFSIKSNNTFTLFDIASIILLFIIGNFIITKKLPSLLDRKNDMFKSSLIKYIIKENLNDFKYNADDGIEPEDYIKSNIYEKFNTYFSEDLMEGYMDSSKVSLAEVETLMSEEYSFKPLFHGLFAKVSLKNKTDKDFIITSKKISISNRDIHETTSNDFNKLYNVYTKNGVNIGTLFNKKTIDLLCEYALITSSLVDIKVSGKNIFFRFGIGPLFDGLIFSSDEKKRLYLFSLICMIIKNVNDMVIDIK